jgi:hypothetical protein
MMTKSNKSNEKQISFENLSNNRKRILTLAAVLAIVLFSVPVRACLLDIPLERDEASAYIPKRDKWIFVLKRKG